MKSLLILLFGGFMLTSVAQQYQYVYRDTADSNYNCYLTVMPDGGAVKGMIVRDYTSLPDTSKASPYQWESLALEADFLVLYTSTTKAFPELYFDDIGPSILDEIVNEVVTKYAVPSQNIFVGGISSSGTRALRYVQYCQEGKSKFNTQIKAAFVVDSPLDMERFYLSATNNHDHFKAGMLSEADHMKPYFHEHFETSAFDEPDRYRKVSVYSHKLPDGGNAKYFHHVPLLMYHEPDIDWWINERGAHYFDINSFDLAGFTNQLRLMGNDRVELITTTGKGFDHEGNRKCHSWTIVDEDYLISWMVQQLD